MATTKTTRYVPAERQEEYEEAADFTAADEQPMAYDLALDGEPRCAACGELLAWHEEACTVAPLAEPQLELAQVAPAAGLAYAYGVGSRVLPAHEAEPHTVVWRGQLKERHPQTGLVHRVPVYRLDNGYWDCYREEELLVA